MYVCTCMHMCDYVYVCAARVKICMYKCICYANMCMHVNIVKQLYLSSISHYTKPDIYFTKMIFNSTTL